MAIFNKSTEQKIDDTQKRLAATNQELDALDRLAPPTSDLVVEEEAALRRLARKEALNRVKAALTTELAALQATLAQEKEEERKRQAGKAQADVAASREKIVKAVWDAYELLQPWEESCNQLDRVSPAFYPRTNEVNEVAIKLGNALELLGAARMSQDMNRKITMTPVQAVRA